MTGGGGSNTEICCNGVELLVFPAVLNDLGKRIAGEVEETYETFVVELCLQLRSFNADYKVHLAIWYEYHHFQFSLVYVFKISDGFGFTPNIHYIGFVF